MSIRVQTSAETPGVSHRWFPSNDRSGAFGTLDFGKGASSDTTVFLHSPAEIDEVIAELVALKQEMAPPVITCSERTCQQANAGEWCVREGEHAEHADYYGETWTTALAAVNA